MDVLNPGKRGDKRKGKMKMNLISHDQFEKKLAGGFYLLCTRGSRG